MAKFQKGVSGNPGGRPKETHELKALARQHTTRAVERLAHWLEQNDPRASVAAASALLDRGYGKPAQTMTGGDGEGPVEVTIRWQNSKDKPSKS